MHETLRELYNFCLPASCLGLLGISGCIWINHLWHKSLQLTDISGTRRDTPEYLAYRAQQIAFEKKLRLAHAASSIVTDPKELARAGRAKLVNPKS